MPEERWEEGEEWGWGLGEEGSMSLQPLEEGQEGGRLGIQGFGGEDGDQ